jgi:hypothetical protein
MATLITLIGLVLVLVGVGCGIVAYNRTRREHGGGSLWPWASRVARRLDAVSLLSAGCGRLPSMATLADDLVPDRLWAIVALTDGGLVNGALSGMMTAQGAWQPVTTDFAARFLAFLHDPREN